MQLTTTHIKCNYITSFFGNEATVTGCWVVKASTVPLANMNFEISRRTLIKNKCSCFKIVIESGIKRRVCDITWVLKELYHHISNFSLKTDF